YCYITAAADARAHLMLDRAHVLYHEGVRLLGLEDAVAKMDALYVVGDLAARLGRTREAVGHFGEMLRLACASTCPRRAAPPTGASGASTARWAPTSRRSRTSSGPARSSRSRETCRASPRRSTTSDASIFSGAGPNRRSRVTASRSRCASGSATIGDA